MRIVKYQNSSQRETVFYPFEDDDRNAFRVYQYINNGQKWMGVYIAANLAGKNSVEHHESAINAYKKAISLAKKWERDMDKNVKTTNN